MARVAYVMLAHEQPDQVAAHVELLTAADPSAVVLIHYDGNAPAADFTVLKDRLSSDPRAFVVPDRARCGWGEFGLVQGPLNALREIARLNAEPDYVYLISGSCLPIRPLAELNRFLDEQAGTEFIQAEDASWMLAGLRRERFEFYFPLSFKKRRRLFDLFVRLQRWLKVKRKPPDMLEPRFGSQWWCLTWSTCRAILAYLDKRPDVSSFFRLTWIPDESFFQTLAFRFADRSRLAGRTLTLHQFSAKGKPLVFFDEHEPWLFAQKFFFARKISPEATLLKRKIAAIAAEPHRDRPIHEVGGTTPFYAAAIWLRGKRERPGQVFRPDHRVESYPGSMSRNVRPYVMLFGPGTATRIAAKAIHRNGGVVLGRLFHRERVGFDDHGEELRGLTPGDVRIRDFDLSLYLCRALDRAPPLPVIEQALFDNPKATFLAYDDPNCLFVACLPRPDVLGLPRDWDAETWRLFLALGIVEPGSKMAPEFSPAWRELIQSVGDEGLWAYTIERLLKPYDEHEIIPWLKQKGVAATGRSNLLIMSWGGDHGGRQASLDEIARVQTQWIHGEAIDRDAFEAAAVALSEARLSQAEIEAPAEIAERLFSTLARQRMFGMEPGSRLEVVPMSGRRS